jgi:hypothetical protein
MITVSDRPSNAPALFASNENNAIRIVTELTEQAYNPITVSGDAGIYFNSVNGGTKGLVLAPWSTNLGGLRIASNGRVGIMQKYPSSELDVQGVIMASGRITNAVAFKGTGQDNNMWLVPSLGAGGYNPASASGDAGIFYNSVVNGGKGIVIGPWSNTVKAMRLDAAGNLIVGGTVTTGSSREIKKNISQLSGDEAVEALMSLMPVKYNYKTNEDELELGFIAEDVPDLVARNDRKSLSPMDFATLAISVIQSQQKQMQQQEELLTELLAKMSNMEAELKVKK